MQLGFQLRDSDRIAPISTVRVNPLRPIKGVRLADARRRRRFVQGAIQHGNGIAHDLLHGNLGIEKLVHERGVGAVLEQPAHEVGQQVLVGSDRSVDPHRWKVRHIREYGRVEQLTHPVQPLEFVDGPGGREIEDGRYRVGIVSSKLRMNDVAGREEMLRAHEIARVRRGLRRVDWETRQAALLRPLDLAVPVSAFHETHCHLPARFARQLGDPIDD